MNEDEKVIENEAINEEAQAPAEEPALQAAAEAEAPQAEASQPEAPAEEPQAKEPKAEAAQPEAPTESMADYDKEIKDSMKPIHEGDLLKGTVIGVSDEELTVDLGIYTDGIVRREDASDDPSFTFQDYKVGQEISATVIKRDNEQGRIQLSLKEAAAKKGWERMQQLMEDGTNITVKVQEAVKGGVTTYVDGIRGFIPASKLSLGYVENLDDYVGKEVEVRVITAEPEGRRLVLSARDILREKREEERKNRISNLQVGLVTEGKVETIKDYGAFVNLGKGMTGLLHVSQISQKRIKTPADVLKEGQTVKVKVIGVKDGKISLSMKALEDAAPQEIEEETYKMPKAENVTTSLGDLMKNIKL